MSDLCPKCGIRKCLNTDACEARALRAQLEAVTRERDALLEERRLVALELGCGLRVPLPGRLADVAAHLVAQVRIGEARLTRERDEARADAARLREALTQVRDAMCATGQEPDGDDDPRRPVASAVWHALASTPSAEPTRAHAERWLSDGPEEPGGTLAFHAEPTPAVHSSHFSEPLSEDPEVLSACVDRPPEPTPRDMRVAEALEGLTTWLSRWRHAITIRAEGAAQAWDELERLHNTGIAVVAKAVNP